VAIQLWCASLKLHPRPDGRGQSGRVVQQAADRRPDPALADADHHGRAFDAKRPPGLALGPGIPGGSRLKGDPAVSSVSR